MFRFCPGQDKPLKHIRTMDLAMMAKDTDTVESAGGTDLLFLSFCWHPSRADTVAITTSSGHVHLVNLGSIGDSWTLQSEPVITHSLEAWCVAISPSIKVPNQDGSDLFTVFSGGDDSNLCYRTCTRTTTSEMASPNYIMGDAALAIRRKHEAGVTAILPLPMLESGLEPVVTGSYDDRIRLLSLGPASASYNPGAIKVLAESNLGGGVWRLKLAVIKDSPTNSNVWQATILASCMHGGARIVELSKTDAGDYQFRVVGSFVEHKSMNYGSDFQPGQTGELQVVSTSFYDKLLCLWKFGAM